MIARGARPHSSARDGRRAAALLGAVVVAVGAGCGPRFPPLAAVRGIVTIDGTPLNDGLVHFIPDERRGTTGRMAVGLIGPDGRFASVTSFRRDDGALVGFHTIEIVVPQTPRMPVGDGPPPPPRVPVPQRYADARTSGITAEVVAGKVNEFEFRLTKK